MFPFYLSYLDQASQAPAPEPERRRGGFLLPRSYGGEDVPEDVARRARARALMAFGIPLLGAGATGDFGGAIAKSFEGFHGAMGQTLEEERQIGLERAEEERRQAQEGREVAQEADRARQADLSFETGQEELEGFRESQRRGRQLRTATAKSAEQMVAEIEELAGAGSPEAKRARAYAVLGEDADVNKLAILHEDATKRQRIPEDYRQETALEVERAGEFAERGFGPQAEASRAERGLSIQERQARAYEASVARQGAGGVDLTANQFQNEVQQEIDKLVAPRVARLQQMLGDVSPETIQRLRREAEPLAMDNVRRRVGAGATGRSLPSGDYYFDAQGNPVQ